MNLKLMIAGLAAVAVSVLAQQPAQGYNVAVCGIDNYAANGTPSANLTLSVSNANNFASRAAYYGWPTDLTANNTSATGSIFVNTGYSGICTRDLGYFAGHSDYRGPFLGGSNGYSYSSGTLITVPENYHWSSSSLKWIVAGPACEWLYDDVNTNASPTWYTGNKPLNRWFKAFNWSYASNPNGSLHAIISHRANTFDVGNVGGTYINNTMGATNSTIGQGWFDANYTQQYLNGAPGIEPALLTAYQTSTGSNWFYEKFTSVWVNPSECANMSYMFNWYYVGSPQF